MDEDASVDVLSFELSAMSGVEKISTSVKEISDCPRFLLYKNAGYAIDQERRWRAELASCRRRKKRRAKFDDSRDLSDSESTRGSQRLGKPEGGSKKRQWDKQQSHLMLAEWFLFMPPNFETEYLFKFCPKGRHVYVTAAKGQTNVYSRTGLCLATMLTRLPGGGLGQSSSQMHRYETTLDCIMLGVPSATMTHEADRSIVDAPVPLPNGNIIFMVLDLVCFKSTSYVQLRFRERCEWLESFHREQIEAYEPNDVARFEVVPAYSCDSETLKAVFSSPPPFELDGVLFYHGDVSYRRGSTPLVGWLKPYMLPEWFPSVSVHPAYLSEMAPDYKDYLSDIQRYKEATQMYSASFRDSKGKRFATTGDVEMTSHS
ncbi:unnamed protein product [Taenia asiatica]|uniref:Snurportin-1 n=1 Tax=Taenia asiatica TaxID=60517 RepID=A0A0R3W8U9_TAEAS|nr:unnamed protein product [Taenia asiatica]